MNLDPENSGAAPSPAPPSLREPEFFEWVFLGPRGLRSGWAAALYVALFALLFTGFALVLALLPYRPAGGGGALTAGALFPPEAAWAASAIAACAVMAALEKRRFGDFGLPLSRAFGARFWQGALWGIAEISVLMLLIGALGGYKIEGLAIAGSAAAREALAWGAFFLVVGFAEESLFRGYLQIRLAEGIGFWPAATLLSLIFGAVHLRNAGEGPVGAASVVVFGLFACLTLRRTGDLWFAIGLHAAFDFGETYIYSVPDSGTVMSGHLLNAPLHGPAWLTGGTIGPEGSVFAFAIMGAMFLLFAFLYRGSRDAHSA
jgi:membrane protease YdiL (CAAX protease family)